MPCPYLPGREEQQLFTELSGAQALDTFDILSQGGFRRSHHIIYKPACTGCNACVPVRIPVNRFKSSRTWRKIRNRNTDLKIADVRTRVSEEQYELFHNYTNRRHNDGEMSKMSRRDYAAMVLSSPVDTALIEFRRKDEKLIAVCLMDRLIDGLSAVYSFFDPDEARRSLGSYIILRIIDEAKRQDLDYVYLGYWVAGSPKMDYKIRFRPIESFGLDGWREI
jgi:arginyl-tRNA--protein-N-Asp/Glu arginylyltransferase|tara:strand:+ start:1462 stop:2127 length:666 start_codon:yes stop_codon:yes gene_type:complete